MKNLLFSISVIVLMGNAIIAQTNNSQNQFGLDVLRVSQVIANDYNQGKFKVMTQALLDNYYTTYLKNYTSPNLAQYNQIYETFLKSTNESTIANSGVSSAAKSFLTKSLSGYSTTVLVDDVKNSALSASEKDYLLKYLSINYNLVKPVSTGITGSGTQKGPSADYQLSYEDESIMIADGKGGFVAWGGTGSLVGFAFGGPIGMMIGGAIGVTIQIIHLNSGNSSGGNTGSNGGGPPPRP